MIVFIVLVFSLLHSNSSLGMPVISDSDASASVADEGPAFLTNYRSTVQIAWTCMSVIFASTWVCIHPHVPGYNSGRWERWGVRGRLFLSAVLFPDRFVSRAFHEWMGSHSIYLEMAEKRENLHLEEPDWSKAGDAAEQLGKDAKRLVEYAKGLGEGQRSQDAKEMLAEGPRLDAEWARLRRLISKQMEVEEGEAAGTVGSKPTSLPKAWTMVHAHFIHMGGIAFKGPEGRVWFKDFRQWTDEDIRRFFDLKLTKERIQDKSKADALSKAFVIIQCLWFVIQCIGRAIFHLPLLELEVTCLAFIACNIGMYAFWWHKPLNLICPLVIRSGEAPPKQEPPYHMDFLDWAIAVVQSLYTGDIGILIFPSRGFDDKIDSEPERTRFPVNYHYKGDSRRILLESLGPTLPWAIFGALHTIAWDSAFPSAIERLLWRISSIVPAVLALVLFFLNLPKEKSLWKWARGVLTLVSVLLIPTNFAARLAFIVLPILQLRNLPPLAHHTVPWSDFLPHV